MQSLCVSFLCLLLAVGTSEGGSWTYTGDHGVDHWDTIGYPTCGGQKQSPIDLKKSSLEQFNPTAFSFTNFNTTANVDWTLSNNGHTVQVSYGGNTELSVSGGNLGSTYKVAQFHFHWGSVNTKGSEHTRDGIAYPMELHVVTFDTSNGNISASLSQPNGLAVLGFFFEVVDADNQYMDPIVNALTQITDANTSTTTITPVALESLIVPPGDFYRYDGSLTTPGCNEVVVWTVFKDTIKISDSQLEKFRQVRDAENHTLVDNNRPVQDLNTRKIYVNFEVDISSAPGVMGCSFLMVAVSTVVLFSI